MRYSMISAAMFAAFSISAQASPVAGYNFDYDISGDRAVRPIQAFDNGQSIYIQMSARSVAPPAVMARSGDQMVPVPFRYEYPYLVIDGAQSQQLVLALDGRTALVSRRGSGVVTGVSAPAIIGSVASVVSAPAVPAAAPLVESAPVAAAPDTSAVEVEVEVETKSAAPVLPAATEPDYSGEMVYRQAVSVNAVPMPHLRAPSIPPAAAVSVSAPAGGKSVHVVKPGDTLYEISGRYGVPVGQIARFNRIANPDLILVGQKLVVGNVAVAAAEPLLSPAMTRVSSLLSPSAALHLVKPGETLYRISGLYGMSVEKIARDNDIANPNLILAGQKLVVGKGAVASVKDKTGNEAKLALRNCRLTSLCDPDEATWQAAQVDPSARLVQAIKMAATQYDRIVVRGQSAAPTRQARSDLSNARARAMVDRLVAEGVPAEKLVVANNLGNTKKTPRVELVLIGASKHA